MLKNEAGVAALRKRFEQDDQKNRETLKFKAGLSPRSRGGQQIKTHERKYMKVLKNSSPTRQSNETLNVTSDSNDDDHKMNQTAKKNLENLKEHSDTQIIQNEEIITPANLQAEDENFKEQAKNDNDVIDLNKTEVTVADSVDQELLTSARIVNEFRLAPKEDVEKKEEKLNTKAFEENVVSSGNEIHTHSFETSDVQNTSSSTIATYQEKENEILKEDEEDVVTQHKVTLAEELAVMMSQEVPKEVKPYTHAEDTKHISPRHSTKRDAKKSRKPPLPPKPKEVTTSSTVGMPDSGSRANVMNRFRKHHQRSMSRFDTRSSTADSVISTNSAFSIDSTETAQRQVKYMATEVYRHWIKHQVQVTDLLPILSLGKRENEIIMSKHKACPSDAMEMLLDLMEDSEIPGIWQRFLDALEALEIIHISKLLRNETEIHHSHTTDILLLVSHDLKQRICIPDFLDLVYEKELLVQSEYDEAKAIGEARGPQEAAKIIIESVNKHLPRWDEAFVDVLEKSDMSDIADLFRFIEQNRPNTPQNDEHKVTDINKKEKISSQKLRERRLEQWKRSDSEATFNEPELDSSNKTKVDNKINDYNALCIAVTQMQSELKGHSDDIKEIKVMLSKILEQVQKC